MTKTPLKTLVLTSSQIQKCISAREAIPAVERAFKDYALTKAQMPAKIYLDLPEYQGDFRAMPAYLQREQACSLKWVNAHPNNAKHRLPAVMAMLILNDPRTGFPLSVMDATFLTSLRTGAAGAVAAKHLALKPVSTVALVGCGRQAETQLQCLREVFSIQEVRIWGHEEKFIRSFLKKMKISSENMSACPTIKEAVSDADVIVTTTPSRKPIIQASWIKEGAHINAIGADAEGTQELDPALLRKGRVIIDDWEQASHSGEINVPLKRKQITKKHIAASLGEVIARKIKGRKSPQDITIFDSTGLAIQDTALAAAVYREALRLKKGRLTKFF